MRFYVDESVTSDIREKMLQVADLLTSERGVTSKVLSDCAKTLRFLETRLIAPGVCEIEGLSPEPPTLPEPETEEDPLTLSRVELKKKAAKAVPSVVLHGMPVNALRTLANEAPAAPVLPPKKRLILR
jgi:hypothetical protein